MSVSENTAVSLQAQFKDLPVQNIFKQLVSRYPQQVIFSTSFSYEDQVITDLIVKSGAAISFFTLDTGRLFNETYTVWSQTLEKYNIRIKAFHPDKKQLQFFVSQNGPNAFYKSIELRKQCCHIRKVIPLKKALEGQAIWITGLRAEHSPERNSLNSFEWDETNQIIKYHPLLQWTTEEIKSYIKENE